MSSSRPSMGVPGVANTGSFTFQQSQPAQPAQPTQSYMGMNGQMNAQATGGNPAFGAQPQNYQPLFNSNGQVTGQTGAFQAIPQNQAMATDDHGVPGFLRRKKQ